MLHYLIISVMIIGLDQLSKAWILAHFQEYQVQVIWPVFNLTLVYNTGAAFSFLADAGGWQHYFFVTLATAVSVALIVWLKRLSASEHWVAWALALVLGGALGNLIDRLLHGKVVDFLQWHWQSYYWPTFNVADMAITTGVILLLIDSFRTRHTA
ncbi:MAG: signal peptidase II [Pseudomonadota bacterium]